MTISADYAPNIDMGNGTTLAFAVTFPFANPLDIDVTIFDMGAGADVVPPPMLNGLAPYDYTVTGTIDPAGTGIYPNGTVAFNTAPPGNTKVIRARSTPEVQEVVLIDNARFPAKAVEGGLDHLELQIQEMGGIGGILSRAIVAPASDGPVNLVLPPAGTRADHVLTFDDAGNIADPGIATGPLDAAIAAFLAGTVSPAPTTAGWARTLAAALVLYAAPVVLADGQPVVVDCRASAADGYGGLFVYRAGDAATVFPQSGLGFVDASGRRFFRQFSGPVAVLWFGAAGDGVVDDTGAINAAEAARALGQTLLFAAKTYKITGDIVITKPGDWLMTGAVFNSTAGRLLLLSSHARAVGYGGCTFNFTSGDPAASLDRAIRIYGGYSPMHNWTGTVDAGVTAFVAASAADAATLSPGDWVIAGDMTPDGNWQRLEWKQVASVSGTTIHVTSSFRRPMGQYPTLAWHKVTSLIEHASIEGINVVIAGAAAGLGIDIQLARHTTIKDCVLDVANGGPAFFHYIVDSPTVAGNTIQRQGGAISSLSATTDGYVVNNRWEAKTVPINGGLLLETGSGFNLVANNTIDNFTGGDGGIFAQWVDFNTFVSNKLTGDGTAIGIHILGGSGNVGLANQFCNVTEGLRIHNDAGPVPARTCNFNYSMGDQVRNSANPAMTVVDGSSNSVLFPAFGPGISPQFSDGGVGTAYQIAAGPGTFIPTLSFVNPGSSTFAYSLQVGKYYSNGTCATVHINLVCTYTVGTGSGNLLLAGLPITGINLLNAPQSFAGGLSPWSNAAITQVVPVLPANDDRIGFYGSGPNRPQAGLVASDLAATGTLYVTVTGTYEFNH